jgi:ribosomal-protein-alanine N-acetyltransferase
MFTLGDLDRLAEIFGDPEVVRHLGVQAGRPQSREETEGALRSIIAYWGKNGLGRWALEDKAGGELIGYAGLRLLEGEPEVVYLLAKEYWHKGLATEAARACLRYGFEELGAPRVVALTRHSNAASQRVLARLGLRHTRDAEFFGVHCMFYEIAREDFQPDDSVYIFRRG